MLFRKKKENKSIKELLRENLKTIPVDMFFLDDPLAQLSGTERIEYLKYFQILAGEKKLMERLKWLINKQARLIIENEKDSDTQAGLAGAMTLNGIAVVKDQIEGLAAMYQKELASERPIPEETSFRI